MIALIQEPKVIDKILGHLRAKGRGARAGPWATGPPGSGRQAAPRSPPPIPLVAPLDRAVRLARLEGIG